MNRTIISVVLVLVAALAITLVANYRLEKQGQQNAELVEKLKNDEKSMVAMQAEADRLRRELAELTAEAAAVEDEGGARAAELEVRVALADVQSRPVAVEKPAPVAAAPTEAEVEDLWERARRSRPGSKAVRNAMRSFLVNMQARTFGPLFEQLGLAGEDLQAFKALLVERELARYESGKDFIAMGHDPVAFKQLVDGIELWEEAADAEIRTILDDKQFAEYAKYRETTDERMRVGMLEKSFQGAGEPLTEAQREAMVTLMNEVNAKHFDQNYTFPGGAQRRFLSGVTLAEMAAEMDVAEEELLTKSEAFLTPQQHAVFAKTEQKRAAQSRKYLQDELDAARDEAAAE